MTVLDQSQLKQLVKNQALWTIQNQLQIVVTLKRLQLMQALQLMLYPKKIDQHYYFYVPLLAAHYYKKNAEIHHLA